MWSPKTKAIQTFMNVVIWQKKVYLAYYTYSPLASLKLSVSHWTKWATVTDAVGSGDERVNIRQIATDDKLCGHAK